MEVIAFIVVGVFLLVALFFMGIVLIDYAYAQRRKTDFELQRNLERIFKESDRRRNASEMAAMIKVVENISKQTRK